MHQAWNRDQARLISATWEYLDGCDFLYTATWLLAMRSWAISTFSLPFTMK